MSEYIIKSYEEGFIEKQVEIGNEVIKDWQFFVQTPAEQLKQTYSADDFDPETRIYCFKGEDMVGFLPAAVKGVGEDKIGFLRLPFVLAEHEEAEDLLFERIVEIFKKKGITKLQAVAGEIWGKTLEQVKRWDFKELEDSFAVYELDVEKATDVDEVSEEVVEFDQNRDLQQMVDIFVNSFRMEKEVAEQNFQTIKDYKGPFLAHYIIHKENKIVARAFAYVPDEEKPTVVSQGNFYFTDESYKKLLQDKLIKAYKLAGIKTVRAFITPQNQSQALKVIEEMGFKLVCFTKLFEKEI
ncbi:MAG: hypothetical protein ACTSSG_11205 [Candidatus Heimdallarchaeaceae archaeon]